MLSVFHLCTGSRQLKRRGIQSSLLQQCCLCLPGTHGGSYSSTGYPAASICLAPMVVAGPPAPLLSLSHLYCCSLRLPGLCWEAASPPCPPNSFKSLPPPVIYFFPLRDFSANMGESNSPQVCRKIYTACSFFGFFESRSRGGGFRMIFSGWDATYL